MVRMKVISEYIVGYIQYEVDYVFCMDVDQIFKVKYGLEILGDFVVQLYTYWYKESLSKVFYERNKLLEAYIVVGEGDFYYYVVVFGGIIIQVFKIIKECVKVIMKDKKNNIEVVWYDESYLNKYFFFYRFIKFLLLEYCWDLSKNKIFDIKIVKFVWNFKNYKFFRRRL